MSGSEPAMVRPGSVFDGLIWARPAALLMGSSATATLELNGPTTPTTALFDASSRRFCAPWRCARQGTRGEHLDARVRSLIYSGRFDLVNRAVGGFLEHCTGLATGGGCPPGPRLLRSGRSPALAPGRPP